MNTHDFNGHHLDILLWRITAVIIISGIYDAV